MVVSKAAVGYTQKPNDTVYPKEKRQTGSVDVGDVIASNTWGSRPRGVLSA